MASPHHYPKEMSVKDRFLSKVKKTDSCWIWGGHLDKTGRGLFCLNGKRPQSSRASWIIHNGEIPAGMHVCHKCDNPSCVNPDHLFLGTHTDNMRDCKNKKRNARGSKHGRAKLTETDIIGLFKMVRHRYFEQQELAKRFGVSRSMISLILKNKKWSHLMEVQRGSTKCDVLV